MKFMPKAMVLRLWIGLAGAILSLLAVFVGLTVTNSPAVGAVFSSAFWWVLLILGAGHFGVAVWVIAARPCTARDSDREWTVAVVVYTIVEILCLAWFLRWLWHPFFG
jgi:hypothetical protein